MMDGGSVCRGLALSRARAPGHVLLVLCIAKACTLALHPGPVLTPVFNTVALNPGPRSSSSSLFTLYNTLNPDPP